MKIQEAIKETGMASLNQNTINYYAKRTNFGDYVWYSVHDDAITSYVADYELQYDTWIPYRKAPILTFKPKNIKIEVITVQCECGRIIKINPDFPKQ